MDTEQLKNQVTSLSRRVAVIEQRTQIMAPVSYQWATEQYLRGADLALARIELAAETMGISELTLRRRLAFEKAKFKHLMADERKRRVLEALEYDPTLTVSQLTDIAGFMDHQTLVRAFRGWTGTTITEYKRQHIGTPLKIDQTLGNSPDP